MIGVAFISGFVVTLALILLPLWVYGFALLVGSAVQKRKFGALLWLSMIFWPLSRTFRTAVFFSSGIGR